MKLVIIESPYAGEIERNVAYARAALYHSALCGEAPLASHLLYPQILDDGQPDERALGIAMGLAWRRRCDYAVFYTDLGWSPGMKAAKELYHAEAIRWEERRLPHEFTPAMLQPLLFPFGAPACL
jgi:hypothetical protein